MLRSPQISTHGLPNYHYHGQIFRLQFGGLQNTLWNEVVVDRWGPQGVFLTLPIHERTRKIISKKIPTWTQTTCDFQRIR